jgi:O-antigen biosynthesis protein
MESALALSPPLIAWSPSRMTQCLRFATPAPKILCGNEMHRCRLPDTATAGFFDANWHKESLALLCADALRTGESDAAFMFADRRCRIVTPAAYDLLLRATASRLMHEMRYAEGDLARAFEIDPTHDLVIAKVLEWGPSALQRMAAANFVDSESQDGQTLRLAMRAFESSATPVVARMRTSDGLYAGWVAWRGKGVLSMTIRRNEMNTAFELEPDFIHPLASEGWSAAEIAVELESPRLQSVTFRLKDNPPLRTILPLRRSEPCCLSQSANSFAWRRGPSHGVNVIVPVYDDYEATKACLDSLEAQGSRIATYITVIDDCSPDANLRALIEDRAARGMFTLLRNEENLGFARSVNHVLEHLGPSDVLLLNADTVLPRGAIDRLAEVAHAFAGVATITPLSNNGEFTSFPRPNVCNPLPMLADIQALHDLASTTNAGEVIDLPTGVGFCLYITRSGIAAVGRLSEAYSRGYYEDVDFCLTAREMGFRNVCATDVFVGHVGTRSFLDEKRGLVVRNLAILSDRFPGHEIDCASFLKADPLAPARARLEEWLTPVGPVVLLIAPAASGRLLALERARKLDDSGDGLHCIHCECDDASGRITIRSVRGVAPQSLAFALAEPSTLKRLQDYLTRLRPKSIELFAPHALPDAVLTLAYALDVPVRLAVGDLDWCDRDLALGRSCPDSAFPGQCDVCALSPALTAAADERSRTEGRRRTRVALGKAEAVIPLDRMAAAFCAANLTSLMISRCAPRSDETARVVNASLGKAVLGVISPEGAPDTDRQVLALERQFERQRINASIVVLGRCLHDLEIMEKGRVFVTGDIPDDEYARVLRQYRISKLFSPYRTRHFGLIDRLSASLGIPKGYFDWSFGALDCDQGDLALDPRICCERAALETTAWMAASAAGAVFSQRG